MADETQAQQQGEVQEPLTGATQGMPLSEVFAPELAAMENPAESAQYIPEPAPVIPLDQVQADVLNAQADVLDARADALNARADMLGAQADALNAQADALGAQADALSAQGAVAATGAQVTAETMQAAASLTQEQLTAPDPIKVKTITVRTGRIVCDVQIADPRFRYTTPRLSAFANGQYPDLPHHACVNDLGATFGYVMEKTSVAHLLEHLTISEQVRNQASGDAAFVGTTEWIDEITGLARIEVAFRDDLVALRAFNEATRFLNMAVLTCLV